MKYLITGGCGFLGSNLSKHVLEMGEELIVIDNLKRVGSGINLNWLQNLGRFKFYRNDVTNINDIEEIIKIEKPDIIFHFAGQVAMTTSIENPILDFETNTKGTLNLLTSINKYCPASIMCFSSTNKVYGDLEYLEYEENETRYIAKGFEHGFDEMTRLEFHSPYGCSKGAADQYVLDFARIYGLKTIVFRHSSIFGGRQFSTSDQGWVGWFAQKAFEIKNSVNIEPFEIFGSGKQVRDILFVDDLIECYFSAINNIEKTRGNHFNIGGGYKNSLSLIELFKFYEDMLAINMQFITRQPRISDQKVFIADIRKAEEAFFWKPKINKEEGLTKMYNWIENANSMKL